MPGGPSWEKVERQLYSRVPRPGEGGTPGYTLSPRAQQAVLSLGIFYLESGFRHSDRILDCLLGLQRSLATHRHKQHIHTLLNTLQSDESQVDS